MRRLACTAGAGRFGSSSGLAELYYTTGAYGQAQRTVDEGLQEAQATSSQKYVAKGWALRGKILTRLGQIEVAGHDLQARLRAR